MTFKIDEYSLSKDCIKFSQEEKKHSKIMDTTLQTAPLLIMNGFQNKEEGDPMKLVSLMV